MGNFLVTLPLRESVEEAEDSFDLGLNSASNLLRQTPNDTLRSPWANVAVFPRLNGSRSRIARDPRTESWSFAIGTWFHKEGFSCGNESQLLEKYLEVGAFKIAEELEGFFVAVVGDARSRETILFTDIIGSCASFHRQTAKMIALSGSSLLLASLAPCGTDEIACQEYLRTGIIYEDRTFYKEVRKLGPASVVRFGVDGPKPIQKYWSVGAIETESIRGSEAAQRLWNSVTDAAVRVGRAFPKPLCDLTGGYDSRALVAAFWAMNVPVATVVSGPENSADVVISRQLAEIAGLPHFYDASRQNGSFKEVAQAVNFTDGEYDLIEYARIFQNHRSMMDRFDISINGSFGELARGYWWELLFPRAGAQTRLDANKIGRLRFAATADELRLFANNRRLNLASHFSAIIERANAGLFNSPNTVQMDHAYLSLRMQRWQGRIASSTNRIWPCLSPFMLRSVLETILAIQVRLRRRGLVIRQMLSRFRPSWAAAPLEHGYPAVPATWKSVHKFLPVITHYGRKVRSKVFPSYGSNPAVNPLEPGDLPFRLKLWATDEVSTILDSRAMKLAGLLDITALDDFLKQSRESSFRFEGEWNRLLGLEHTLRLLKSVQVK